ncbi:23S rRNA (guanosine(2251)-2'-O)-methyltransferase RlmB [Mycoplasmopsis iners]|uniref:23S rRNA (guanosine(2251)-2'-O)-methyltransferase RlmB n=1 Tax=Mycoplasmopsis iners TaxID=76630 RepID=UPI0004964809
MQKLYVCGRNSVLDALKHKMPIEKVILLNSDNSFTHKIKTFGCKIEFKDKTFFDAYSNENHQGVIAILKDFPIYELKTIENEKPNRVLVLDHINDPHNFGAIIRTANAFGIKHIIIPKERSVGITSTVLKISSGGFVGVKIIKVNNIAASLNRLRKNGYWIYVTALEQNSVSLDEIEFNNPSVLVVGNEGDGVSIPVLREADQIVHIEQKGTVQSLNVSVATGILLHKFTKE